METQTTICDWADQAFGPTDLLRVMGRADEEMSEAIRAICSGQADEIVAVECADVLIVLARAARLMGTHVVIGRRVEHVSFRNTRSAIVATGRFLRQAIYMQIEGDRDEAVRQVERVWRNLIESISDLGTSAQQEIDAKMAINRTRTWASDGTGCGYHTRDKGTDNAQSA